MRDATSVLPTGEASRQATHSSGRSFRCPGDRRCRSSDDRALRGRLSEGAVTAATSRSWDALIDRLEGLLAGDYSGSGAGTPSGNGTSNTFSVAETRL